MKKFIVTIMVLASILSATAAMAATWVSIGYTEDSKHIFIDKDSIQKTENAGENYATVTLKCNYKDGAHDIANLRLRENPQQFAVEYVIRYNWKGGVIEEYSIEEKDQTLRDILPDSTCGKEIFKNVF